jgi:hypothetical protein
MHRGRARCGRHSLPALPNGCRDGVVPSAVERVAAQQAARCQPAAAQQAEALDRLDRIGAAARGVTAARRPHRADRLAVEGDHPDHGSTRRPSQRLCPAHRAAPAWPDRPSTDNAAARSRSRACEFAPAASGRARTTVALPGGSWSRRARTSALSRRTTRWRVVLGPTARDTTKPTRAGSPGKVSRAWCTTSAPRRVRRPRRTVMEKSDERRIRHAEGSTSGARVSRVPGSRRSGRQLATALAAASGDDGTSGTSAHAQPEAVRLGTAAIVRLEGALAHGTRSKEIVVLADARCGRLSAGWSAGTTRRPSADAVRVWAGLYCDPAPDRIRRHLRYGSSTGPVKLAGRRIKETIALPPGSRKDTPKPIVVQQRTLLASPDVTLTTTPNPAPRRCNRVTPLHRPAGDGGVIPAYTAVGNSVDSARFRTGTAGVRQSVRDVTVRTGAASRTDKRSGVDLSGG